MTDPALATQVYQVFIRASAEQIWQALTDPDITVQYFHGARITVTPERRTTRGPEGQVWGDSPVEVWDPPHKYVAGWLSLYDEELGKEPMSRITFEIEPQDDGDYCRVDRHPRPPRELAQDRAERAGPRLDVRALEPQDLPRDGRAAPRCLRTPRAPERERALAGGP